MIIKRSVALILAAMSTSAYAVIPTDFVSNATPTDYVTTIADNGTTQNGYAGTYGTITFNDWGYVGPAGVTANDFQVGAGFDAANVGQIQSVVTVDADWLTPDPSSVTGGVNSVKTDSAQQPYGVNYPLPNANMDGGVNFYEWAYTTPTSTFSNMQIDKAGNYFVAKDDMNFGYYERFNYTTDGGATIEDVNTGIDFQPYAISDAKGWCGSTMVSDPNGLEQMAGQVTFDFAFDAYLFNTSPENNFGPPATQIVPDFVMRSFGDYTIDMGNDAGVDQYFEGSAVGNNFNPVTGELDEDFQNKVSFLGAGVVPEGMWVLNSGDPELLQIVKECDADETVACSTEGATWHSNAFAGYAFLLRADAERTLEFISPDGHSIYVATAPVPVPAAVWLFGSGLLGLIGVSRRGASKQTTS